MKTREQVALGLLDGNPWQPRQEIDPETLQELADSIHQLGMLQVPLARPAKDLTGLGFRPHGNCVWAPRSQVRNRLDSIYSPPTCGVQRPPRPDARERRRIFQSP